MLVTTSLYGDIVLLTTPMLTGVKESITFKTDVFESLNGAEERTPLKDTARQIFGVSSYAIGNEFSEFFNVAWGGVRQLWGLPLYNESQYVGDVNGSTITCITNIYDFRANSLALLKNENEIKVIEISTVSQDSITLKNTATMTGATLMPLRVCFIDGDIKRNTTGWYSTCDFDFVVVDEPKIYPSEPSQFLGDDIYFFRLGYTGDTAETKISQQQNVLDAGIGKVYRSTDWNSAQYSKEYRRLIQSKQEAYSYRDFIFRRQGKYRDFWLPTFEKNLVSKSTGTVSATLLVENAQYMQLTQRRKHIAIKAGNEWTAHTITSASFINATTTALTISPPLNKIASSIRGISYLGLYRLDADSVTLNHQGANIIEVSVPIIEVSA